MNTVRLVTIVAEAVLEGQYISNKRNPQASPKRTAEDEAAFVKAMKGVTCKKIGTTMANPILKVIGLDGLVCLEEPLSALKAAWQNTLPGMLK